MAREIERKVDLEVINKKRYTMKIVGEKIPGRRGPRYVVWGRLYDGSKIAVSSGADQRVDKATINKLENAFYAKLGQEYNTRIRKRESSYDINTGMKIKDTKIKVGKTNRYFLTWKKSGWLYIDKKKNL